MRITVGDLITRACFLAASVEAGPLRGTRWLRDASRNSSESASLPTINRDLAETDVASTLSTLPDISTEITTPTQGGSNVGNSGAPSSSSEAQGTIVTTIAAPKPTSSSASSTESTTQSAEPGFSVSPSGFTTSTTLSLTPSRESTPETASSTQSSSQVSVSSASQTLSSSSAVLSSSAITVTSSPGSSGTVSSASTSTLEITSFLSGTVVVPPPPPKTSAASNSTSAGSSSTSPAVSSIETSAPVISSTAQPFPNITSETSSLTTTTRSNGTLPSSTTHSPTGTPNTEIPTGVATSIPSPTAGVNASIYEKNIRQANHLNLLYSKLTPDSACSEGQAACVAGSTGICNSNGAWDLYPCSSGTACVAVPVNVTDGVVLNCLDKDTAQSILGKNATIFFPTPGHSGKYTKTVSVTISTGVTTIATATATITVPAPSASAPLVESNSVVVLPSSSAPPPASEAASTSSGGRLFTGTVIVTRTSGSVVETVTEKPVFTYIPDPESTTSASDTPEAPTRAASESAPTTTATASSEPNLSSIVLPPAPIQTVTVVSVSTATATETVTTTDTQTTTTTQPGGATVTATVTVGRQGPGNEAGRADKFPTPPVESLPAQNTVVPLS